MSSFNKNNKKKWTALSIFVLLLFFIWLQLRGRIDWKAQADALKEHLHGDNNLWLVLAILMAPVSWLIESLKWRFLLLKVQRINLRTAFCSVLTGMSFAFISPGKIGDFAGRILYLDSDIRLRGTIATLVGNFAHIVITFIMGITGFSVLLNYTSENIILVLFFSALISGTCLLAGYLSINKFDLKIKNKKSRLGKLFTAFKILKRYDQKDLLKILFFSLLKFSTYTAQFVLVTQIFGSTLSLPLSFFIASAMFWMIMVIPSFLFADVVVRGYVANLLFVGTGMLVSDLPVLAGTYFIWLVNWVMPSMIGAFSLLIYRLAKKKKDIIRVESPL